MVQFQCNQVKNCVQLDVMRSKTMYSNMASNGKKGNWISGFYRTVNTYIID